MNRRQNGHEKNDQFCNSSDELLNEHPVSELKSPVFQIIEPSGLQDTKKKAIRNSDESIPLQLPHQHYYANSRSRSDISRSGGKVRWVILTLSCFIMFGNYYAFDNPSALNRQLRTWMKESDSTEFEFEYYFNLLYTAYSAPNIILPFMVGRALDRVGSRSFLVGLSILMCLGQAVFSVGVTSRTWTWMIIGRIIFGLGGESLAVAQSRIVTEWFLGKELGLAIGLNLSVARIGTVFNNNASPRIAKWPIELGGGVSGACWVGFTTCLFSLACTLLCVFIDTIYTRRHELALSSDPDHISRDGFDCDAGLSDCNNNTVNNTTIDDLDHIQTQSTNTAALDTTIHPTFYLLLFLNFFSYGAVLCFNNVASAYLQVRYFPGNIIRANGAMSIPDVVAIILVPVVGFLVDRSGYKLNVIILGQASLALGHFLLASSQINPDSPSPYSSLMLLGVGYSTLLAIWSCVPFLVGPKRQATAYGFLTSSTNLSATLLPIVVAALISSDESYFRVGMFFSSLGVAGLVISILTRSIDLKKSLALNSSRIPHYMATRFQITNLEASRCK